MLTLKSYLVPTLICLSTSVLANPHKINTYDDLLYSLDSGHHVRAVIHFENCTLESGDKLLTITGGFDYDIYNHYKLPSTDSESTKEMISTSKTVFSISNFHDFGKINNYIRLRVFNDNTAEFFAAILDPITQEEKTTATYNCPLGKDKAGVVFFDSK